MDKETLNLISVSVLSILNLVVLVYQTMKKVPREVEKMQAEKNAIYGELAESNMSGAQISNALLVDRIAELKKDKRDAWNHIAKLEKVLLENKLSLPQYVLTETDPKIKAMS